VKLKLNVYPVIADMEEKIAEVIQEAVDKRASLVEIAYGQVSKSTKKRILSFLNNKEIRRQYYRLEKTEKGWGRIYLYFRLGSK